jgi:beta-galactosidase
VVNWAMGLANVKPVMETPAGVEVAARRKGDQRLLFVLNHDAQPHRVSLDDTYLDRISGAHESGEVALAGREVLILVKEG